MESTQEANDDLTVFERSTLEVLWRFVQKNDHRLHGPGTRRYSYNPTFNSWYNSHEKEFAELLRREYIVEHYATEGKYTSSGTTVYVIVTEPIHEKLQVLRQWQEL